MEHESENADNKLIDELAELCGIVPYFWDIFGTKHVTSLKTKKSILSAMHLGIDTPDALSRAIASRRSRPWTGFVEPVFVQSASSLPVRIPVYIALSEGEERLLSLRWSTVDEAGRNNSSEISGSSLIIKEQKWIDGVRYVKLEIEDLFVRDIGYYKFHIVCEHPGNIFPNAGSSYKRTSTIIIAPDKCYMPPELETGRTWGLSVNLYSLRSAGNWGIGDFADLKHVLDSTAGWGGGFVGINPLHAIPNTKPHGLSPYSPISRLYRNFIYLDLAGIPDVNESANAQGALSGADFQAELRGLRTEDLIDYDKVAMLKERILRYAFEHFREVHLDKESTRGRSFRLYREREGGSLESFAIFCALRKHFIEDSQIYAWQAWPEVFRNRDSDVTKEFAGKHQGEILFYQYLQWLIDEQLEEVKTRSQELGLSIGLYNDLAIGAVSGGSDVWCNHEIFGDADVGAPPDDFSPDGQNWGFPPIIPERMKETGYDLFIRTMRENMKHSGALRIDHALGLFRLFWIPLDQSAAEGAYVEYPSDDLLRIVALESVRNRTIVIAEDLGTIGDNVRDALKQFSMLSYRLFYFERNYPDPTFVIPQKYPEMALCSVTTHDLPTIYGYWVGRDIEVRKELGKYPDEASWKQQLEERERDKGLILSVLKERGILRGNYPSDTTLVPMMTHELCRAIYQYLAMTPCKLVLVSLDDIIGTLNQQNMPGTVDTHPNWIQKTPLTLEAVCTNQGMIELADMFRRNRA